MKHFFYGAIAIVIFSFNSCQNNEEVKCLLPGTSISSNSPVVTGENIFLKTPDYLSESNVTFEWTGPNNFYSNSQNPVISNVTSNMAGDYKLIIKKGICKTDVFTSTVEVITNTVTCQQSDDTATFSNEFYSNSLYSNSTSINNNKFQISGGAYNTSVKVIFHNDNSPKQGVYQIINNSLELSNRKVHVIVTKSSRFDYYALSGDVLLTIDKYGKQTIKFCSVPFAYSSNTFKDMTGTVKFTVNR